MKKIRVGLIGLGYIGKVHLRSCLKNDSAELVAVSDVSKKALNIAKKMGVKTTYTDYKDILADDSIEAVIIALPTFLHLPCATEAAEAGKHIMLEKPIAKNVEEGKQILSTVEKNNVKLMVGYPFRFFAPFQALKDQIDQAEFGEIPIAYATNIASGPFFHRADGHIPRPIPEWWFNKELTGGGALIDLGCHMINLSRWYFGEVTNVQAHLGYKYGFDFEDHASCILQFDSGTKAIINVGWFAQTTTLEVEVFGTVKHALTYHIPPSRVITALQLILRRTPKYFTPHYTGLAHFIDCIQTDSQPSSTGYDGLKDLEVIEQAYKNQIYLD